MKKYIILVIITLIVLVATFALIDYTKVKNNEEPIFCMYTSQYDDGGTTEYFGLGYKIIDFNTLFGFDEVKIGTWFISYKDYEQEIMEFESEKFKY